MFLKQTYTIEHRPTPTLSPLFELEIIQTIFHIYITCALLLLLICQDIDLRVSRINLLCITSRNHYSVDIPNFNETVSVCFCRFRYTWSKGWVPCPTWFPSVNMYALIPLPSLQESLQSFSSVQLLSMLEGSPVLASFEIYRPSIKPFLCFGF